MEGTIALFIPILALSIPIVAIVANAATKKYKTQPDRESQLKIEKLEERIAQLEQSVEDISGSVNQLEDKQRFMSKLIEDK